MNSFFPNDLKKLKVRIRTYERALSGGDRDGAGKRYLLGPMYLLLGDVEGALKHFEWFDKTYADDCGEPYQYLCWTLALYKAGKLDAATLKFKQTMLENLYLIPAMLGESPEPRDIWRGSSMAELDYAEEIPVELLRLWDDESKIWAKRLWNDPTVTQFRERYIDIERQLKTVEPGPKRTMLVNESFRMRSGSAPLRVVK